MRAVGAGCSRTEVRRRDVTRDRKTATIAELIRAHCAGEIHRALVVGCGSGREAAQLSRLLQAEVVGIDVNASFDPRAAEEADLRYGDARHLEFPDGSFDLIYSFHALEHIRGHRLALAEMRRVLADERWYCIGTPNRARIVGYIGSPASIRQKLRWNLGDLKARVHGRFRNELGSHAGFTSEELKAELEAVFATAEEVTSAYYLRLYASHARLISALEATGLSRYLFPAVYFLGTK
jgi:ubiquinone/menaquinone biosynthesis C-methylase UbiE